MRTLLEGRLLLAATFAATVGIYGLHTYPVEREQVFLAVMEARGPEILQAFAYAYALLWFSTPFCVASLVTSPFAIVVSRHAPTARFRPLPSRA